MGLQEGDWVWTPCARQGFRRSTIVSVDLQGDSVFVESKDQDDPTAGGQFPVRRSEVRPFYDSGPEKTFPDNTEMVHLDDANILDNLRRRFLRDEIYTYTANVLLAVNPYKQLKGLYTPEKVAEYRGKRHGELPPHPYTIADTAYRHLLREKKDQALVISGESGAGKTETAKTTMHYLTQVSRTDQAHGGRIQDKIINANPILESFGNASTVRNANSSRFGKYNEMCFNRVGSLIFAGIKTYLLESSRVVGQQEGERNFHVFYEMLYGLEPDVLDELQLDPTLKYRLLYTKDAQPCAPGSPEALREKKKFIELRTALGYFCDDEVQQQYWEVVAALIHLGEVEFVELAAGAAPAAGGVDPSSTPTPKTPAGSTMAGSSPGPSWSPTSQVTIEGSDEAKVEVSHDAQDSLEQAAYLLGISQHKLEQVLKWKEMTVKRQGGRTSHIYCPRTKTQASHTLRSIIKIIYKRLFDKIVERINESSSGSHDPSGNNHSSIGTLDIYGFERLQTNSFEQLCINLANERLQQFFIEEVLEGEQRVYADEGLNICRWTLPDNQPVLQGIQGIMAILDEHSLRLIKNLTKAGEDKDVKFCEHVHREQIKDPRGTGPVMALKMNGVAARAGTGMALHDGFQIRHYAGDVAYSTKGWIDKNNDALVPECEALLGDATKQLTNAMSDKSSVGALSTTNSVGNKYLGNLSQLLATLKTCSVHYIRCFNPNKRQLAGDFDKKYVLDQVIQCGTVELVKIMHHGFPHRCMLRDLRERFARMLPREFEQYSDRDFILAIMLAFGIDEYQWTLGVTRLFLKAGQLRVLEHLRDREEEPPREIVAKIRMMFARKKVRTVARVVCLMAWWPGHVRKQRRMGLIRELRKAAYIFVRLHRWYRTVRIKLYGEPPAPEAQQPGCDMQRLGLTYGLPGKGTMVGQQGGVGSGPQVFVALNSYEEPQYAAFLQSDINMRNPIADDILKLWQRNTTESILFHDGKRVLSARLSPRSFLRVPGSRGPATVPELGDRDAVYGGRSLDDVRVVDAHESGRAFPLADVDTQCGTLTCMCQHRTEKQIFATSDAENQVAVWKWLGTEHNDFEKPAVKILGGFRLPPSESIFQMCFLSSEALPRRIAEKQGMVLVILTAEPGRHWLLLQIITVYQGNHFIECVEPVGAHTELMPSQKQLGVQVSFLTSSFTDRIIVLGGRGLLQFWQVCEDNMGQLCLALIEDVAQNYPDIKHTSMVSCLSLPPPIRSGGILDWIVIGDSSGKLYGFRFDIKEGKGIEVNSQASGRFRSNTHTHGLPIRALVGTYGGTPDAHHRQVQAKGLSYSLFLNRAPLDDRGFYSLGDDGKLLAWRLLDATGWTNTSEITIQPSPSAQGFQQEPSNDMCQFVACHSSRLVPHIIIIVDQVRKVFMCYDRTSPEELSTDALCCYA